MSEAIAWSPPFWIAHRGAGLLAPENTLAAFRLGAAHGYRAFECDVQLSSDGEPFLLHDATLERTTPAHGPAHKLKWQELSRLDAGGWHGRVHAGERVPHFEAIAEFCLRNAFFLNIELKPANRNEHETGRSVAASAARLWQGAAAPSPLLSSFQPLALHGARDGNPSLPRALLLDQWREGWLEEAVGLQCVAIVCAHAMLDAEAIERIHRAGMRSMAYTVNDPAEAQRLRDARIDGLITDAVDRFSPAVGIHS